MYRTAHGQPMRNNWGLFSSPGPFSFAHESHGVEGGDCAMSVTVCWILAWLAKNQNNMSMYCFCNFIVPCGKAPARMAWPLPEESRKKLAESKVAERRMGARRHWRVCSQTNTLVQWSPPSFEICRIEQNSDKISMNVFFLMTVQCKLIYRAAVWTLHFPLQLHSCFKTRYFPARSTTPFHNCLGGLFDMKCLFSVPNL